MTNSLLSFMEYHCFYVREVTWLAVLCCIVSCCGLFSSRQVTKEIWKHSFEVEWKQMKGCLFAQRNRLEETGRGEPASGSSSNS